MKYHIIAPNQAAGIIDLPTSKSISNRALMINALSGNQLVVKRISNSDDTHVMIEALKLQSNEIDVGAAGTSMRFLTAYFANKLGTWQITGSERMKNRPIAILVDALRSIGAEISYVEKEGFPPLQIKGKELEGGKIALDGSVSSQYISALLMVAPIMKNGLTLELLGHIASRPYIQLTLNMMRYFGIDYDWQENVIKIAHQTYTPRPFTVESDWSGASYWYEIVACANNASIRLLGLQRESSQGDSKVADIFSALGVETVFSGDQVMLKKKAIEVSYFEYDFDHQPDLAQTVVVTCCLKDIPFKFTGLQSLHIKETDRIAALICELRKLGYVLRETAPGVLEYKGEKVEKIANPSIATYEDHRMAMAFAPAALMFSDIYIENPQVVSKSYPQYWDHLKEVGFDVEEIV
ncbi:MAG: 3-phosphoshikimate 1-carboxyvinyltransferase [Paludibacteraceae bacterium]|nr:3-phosphoshikimate 1-carboxyvinyltransferase [Paludibacteraceae bacterium]